METSREEKDDEEDIRHVWWRRLEVMREANPTNTSTEKRTSRTIAVLVVLTLHEVDEDLQFGKTQALERKRKVLQNLTEYRFVGNVRGEYRIVKHKDRSHVGAQTIQEPREAMSMAPCPVPCHVPCSLRLRLWTSQDLSKVTQQWIDLFDPVVRRRQRQANRARNGHAASSPQVRCIN